MIFFMKSKLYFSNVTTLMIQINTENGDLKFQFFPLGLLIGECATKSMLSLKNSTDFTKWLYQHKNPVEQMYKNFVQN